MATNIDTKKGVPGIPTGALDAITDENTRVVLQAIVDGWNVRNGSSGDGASRFITAAEVGDQVNKTVIQGIGETLGVGGRNTLGGFAASIAQILSDLQADIIASYEWQKLGEQIQLIEIPNIFKRIGNVETVISTETVERVTADTAMISQINTLGARVGANETGLRDEVTMRVNSDNALASAVNKLWATVGGNTALVAGGSNVSANNLGAVAEKWEQVQSTIKDPVTGQYIQTAAVRNEARAETDKVKNRMTAEQTVKIDLNGYVTGYGLFANADMTTGATSSTFAVRADRFWIGSASGGTRRDIVPFQVLTTQTTVNGVTRQPGVYITDATIGNGAIGSAHIGNLAVDTLKIAGNAVTVSAYANNVTNHGWGGGTALTSSYATVCTLSGVIPYLGDGITAGTIITAHATLYEGGGSAATIEVSIWVNGQVISSAGCTLGESKTVTVTGFASLAAGNHTVQIKIRTASPGAATKNLACISGIVVMSGKR